MDEAGRLGIEQAADGHAKRTSQQLPLFEYDDTPTQPSWVEVNTGAIWVENCREFGGPWLAMQVIERLKLDKFLDERLVPGKEHVRWSITSMILVIARLLNPSSELFISEQWYPNSALPELLGVPAARVDDNRLYRCLDELLPHKGKRASVPLGYWSARVRIVV